MQQLHLVMPMGGAGTRFLNNGFECPKPLISLCGKPFFYWAVMSLYRRAVFDGLHAVVLQDHVDRFAIDKEILRFFPEAQITVLPHVLDGAVLTCLAGVESLPDDASLVFNDCDHYFSCAALDELLRGPAHRRPDGALLSFRSQEPKFSYLACNEAGLVTRTVEKQVISDRAICGAYFFGRKDAFCTAAERYLHACSYNEFFMSGVYNELIAAGGRVLPLDVDCHISFGTPEEYHQAAADGALKELTLEC